MTLEPLLGSGQGLTGLGVYGLVDGDARLELKLGLEDEVVGALLRLLQPQQLWVCRLERESLLNL